MFSIYKDLALKVRYNCFQKIAIVAVELNVLGNTLACTKTIEMKFLLNINILKCLGPHIICKTKSRMGIKEHVSKNSLLSFCLYYTWFSSCFSSPVRCRSLMTYGSTQSSPRKIWTLHSTLSLPPSFSECLLIHLNQSLSLARFVFSTLYFFVLKHSFVSILESLNKTSKCRPFVQILSQKPYPHLQEHGLLGAFSGLPTNAQKLTSCSTFVSIFNTSSWCIHSLP